MIDAALAGAKGLMLYGPPGSGKTDMARALAEQLGAAFFVVEAADLGMDETYQAAIHRCSGKPAVMMIEGLCSAAPSIAELAVATLLEHMDELRQWKILVVASAIRPEGLDPRLCRDDRFLLRVPVGFPNLEQRRTLLDIQVHDRVLAPGADLDALARRTPGMSSDELADLVWRAAAAAESRGEKAIQPSDFDAVLESMSRYHEGAMSGSERFITAYHEAGHALASQLLEEAEPVRRVTLVPHGLNALGLMPLSPSESHKIAGRAALVHKMAVALAGRAAETLAVGDARPETMEDLETARRVARDLFDGDENEVDVLVAEASGLAQGVLCANMGALDAVAATLLDQETLKAEDISLILRPAAA